MRYDSKGFILCLLVASLALWGCSDEEATEITSSDSIETPRPDSIVVREAPGAYPNRVPGATPNEATSQGLVSPQPSQESTWLRQLVKRRLGKIVFNTPDEMHYDESKPIALLLSPSKSIEELTKELELRTFQEESDVGSATVEVTDRMQATLKGRNFEVEDITNPTQAVRDSGTTQWLWEVTPKASGAHYLYLTLSAVLDLKGEATPQVIDVYERRIDVRITFPERVASLLTDNWKWIIGTLITLFGIWIVNFRNQGEE